MPQWEVLVSPWQKEMARHVLTILTTSAIAWAGFGEPLGKAKEAQDQCCPIARQCVEGLVR
jgi:hypothetical protein